MHSFSHCSICAEKLDPGMGPWVPFCSRHWFSLTWEQRRPLFELYRHVSPNDPEMARALHKSWWKVYEELKDLLEYHAAILGAHKNKD